MVSKWTRDAFIDEGIFEGVIRLNKYPYMSLHTIKTTSGTVTDLMTSSEQLSVISARNCTLKILGS